MCVILTFQWLISSHPMIQFLQNYAVSLGSVSVVNALQGTQFVFLLGLTSFLDMKILADKDQYYIYLVYKAIFIHVINGLISLYPVSYFLQNFAC